MEIEDVVTSLFTQEPKLPRSVRIDVQDPNNDSDFTAHDLFNFLVEVFNQGTSILFGNPETGRVDLDSLTKKDFLKIDTYFQSFGFRAFVDFIDTEDFEIYQNEQGQFDYTPYFLANLDIKYKGTYRALLFTVNTPKKLYFIGFGEL